uniref:Uncharacterized protein n=1 Tax=Aedes aegypti TaxID=7159 RepID=A0A6E8P811_AEDAE
MIISSTLLWIFVVITCYCSISNRNSIAQRLVRSICEINQHYHHQSILMYRSGSFLIILKIAFGSHPALDDSTIITMVSKEGVREADKHAKHPYAKRFR